MPRSFPHGHRPFVVERASRSPRLKLQARPPDYQTVSMWRKLIIMFPGKGEPQLQHRKEARMISAWQWQRGELEWAHAWPSAGLCFYRKGNNHYYMRLNLYPLRGSEQGTKASPLDWKNLLFERLLNE